LGTGEDQEHLINIGNNHILLIRTTRPGSTSRQATPSWQHRFDSTLPISYRLYLNLITNDNQIGCLTLFLESSTQTTLQNTLFRLHPEETTLCP
jgi:hypothetical protein